MSTQTQLWPRLDFPIFEGSNPRSWIRKCQKIFQVYQIPDPSQVEAASMFLDTKPDIWFQEWKEGRDVLKWDEFVAAICRRFGESEEISVVEDFLRLKQTGTIEAYLEKLERSFKCG